VNLLVIGASGHLGSEVARLALTAGASVTGTHARPETPAQVHAWSRLDVCDPFAVHQLIQRVRPDAVINASYARGSWAAMAPGAAHVASASAAVGARLVHISSDAVFGGRPEHYTEDDDPAPVTSYGAAKAAAETAVAAVDPSAAIVRTSLILGDETTPQVRFALDLLTGRAVGHLFTDEIRCPVDGADLASAVLELVGNDYAGVINIAGPQAVTRAELGFLVADRYRLPRKRLPVCSAAESGMVRALDVKLDSSKAAALLRTRLRPAATVLTPRPKPRKGSGR